jgi:DHA1 family bicyclomycin/chloramphenicol resistance-like MFS transporter
MMPVSREPSASRRIVAVLLLLMPVSQVAVDAYTPALPQMVDELHSSNQFMQNTVTAFMLGITIAVLPVGLIADALGRKRIVLAGLALMVLTSIGCALVESPTLLLGLRFVQGVGASVSLLAATVAADYFRGARLVSVVGWLGAAWAASPVLAPVVGGFLVQVGSWRLVFGLLAVMAAAVALVVARVLPETLDEGMRAPVDLRAATRVIGMALRHRIFMGYVAIFSLMAGAETAFGAVGPFLYQVELNVSPAAYGLIALALGTADLAGELATGGLARRTTTRRLGFGALTVFCAGAVILVVSAEVVGVDGWAISVGAALALIGCGVLCPQTQGLALGVFTDHLGLISGLVSTFCNLVVTAALAYVAFMPDDSTAPIGWLYVGVGALVGALLLATTSSRRKDPSLA